MKIAIPLFIGPLLGATICVGAEQIAQPAASTATADFYLTQSAVHPTGHGSYAHTFLVNQKDGRVWQMMCAKEGQVVFSRVEVEGIPEKTAAISQPLSASPPEKKPEQASHLDAMFGILGAIIGGVIGVGGSLMGASRAHNLSIQREEKVHGRLMESVRNMLAAEIDENLARLRDEKERLDDPQGMAGLEWMAVTPWPQWNTTAWQGTVQLAGEALQPQQVQAVQRTYGLFHSLTSARESLSRAYLESHGDRTQTIQPFERVQALMNELLGAGNPLRGAATSYK